jgi:hypothetical protein
LENAVEIGVELSGDGVVNQNRMAIRDDLQIIAFP